VCCVCPAGTRRDQQQSFFIGGSEELADMSYAAVPKGHKGRALNKYGYKTETAGTVKVGINRAFWWYLSDAYRCRLKAAQSCTPQNSLRR
jgi:Meckel syndrome type 1 protein